MDTVRFYDFENRRVVTIPAAELAPGSVQVRMSGSDEIIWVEARHLRVADKPRHQDLDQGQKDAVRRIMENFQEQNPMTFKEWVEGFLFDADPEQELVYWLRASIVFARQALGMEDGDQRAELYHLVCCCLNSDRENLLRTFAGRFLAKQKVKAVLDAFYGKR